MKIIVIEGPDGAGKTTVAKKLEEVLQKKNIKAKYIHFPHYEYYTGDFINKCLHGELGDFTQVNPHAQHMMYALDRYCWFKKHEEEYRDHILIFDRYVTSSLIYQTAAKKLQDLFPEPNIDIWMNSSTTRNFIESMIHTEYNNLGIPKPSIIFFLNVDKRILDARINAREESKDNFETDYFADLVYNIAMIIKKKYNFTDIDYNDMDIDKAIDEILKFISININFSLNNLN